MELLRDIQYRAYIHWMDIHIPKEEIVANCTIWTRVMRTVFPELIHVGGYVVYKKKENDPFWNQFDIMQRKRTYYHEYLRDPRGNIVDPTWMQFCRDVNEIEYLECEEHLII